MDSSSLLELLDEIFEWISDSDFPIGTRVLGLRIPWTVSQLHIIHEYVSKLGVDSDLSLGIYTRWGLHEVWQGRFEGQSYRDVSQMVVSFVQDLHELFKVPTVQQLPHSHESCVQKKNELPAVFIGFLFQIQQHGRKSEFINPQLMEELRSLIAILGDTLFQATEDEQVQNIWAEFEGLANEAGRLVHSFVFAPDRVSAETMEGNLVVLLESIHLFKGNIMEILNSLPNIYIATRTSQANCSVDSLFIVNSLVCDLENLMNRDDDEIVQVTGQIEIVHHELIWAQSLIKHLNIQHYLEIKELKEPMMRIRDIAYEAEYLINYFLVKDIPLWYLMIRLNHVIHSIKLIGNKLQEMKENYDIVAINLGEEHAQVSGHVTESSTLDNDIIIGFEEHERNIMNQLVKGRDQLQIISIFGMPGVGKTTLAKISYNHPSVSDHFHRRAWCVVSQTHQKKNVLADILLCVGRSNFDKDTILNMDVDVLSEQIHKSLYGTRYLIVMDDVWDSNVWNDFQRFFPDEGNGSRILFTTRIKDVAPSGSIIYELPILPDDKCLELLEEKVFHKDPRPPLLHEIGNKVVGKCYGLPLAVVVLAGILSTKEESIWENVGRSLDSYFFTDQNSSIMQILKLSYEHLPRHLKPCFLFLGVFRDDAKIPIKKLVQLWVAEGFIPKNENKSTETIAEEYLMELVYRSLVMVDEERSGGGAKTCVIHDLLRDLCLRLAEEENFLTLLCHDYSLYSQKYQRFCVQIYPVYEPTFESLVLYGPHVRTLFVSLPDVSLYLSNMKLLRVLNSKTTWFDDYDLIGTELLVHLRYLAISRLPQSIDRNVNLEFLIVNREVLLCTKMLKMIKLRYLCSPQITFDNDCDAMEASNLEFLSTVDIRNSEDQQMLKCCPHLCKLKCKYGRSWEENGAYPCPDFSFLTKCKSLKVTTFLSCGIPEIELPSNVQKLTLSGLRLSWENMSMIGKLSRLEVLKLETAAFVGETWETTEDEFQQLKFLKMEFLDLSKWNVYSSEHFPKLQRLIVMNCHNLEEVPDEIGDIACLQVIEVEGRCRKSAVMSVQKIQQEQLDMGNEELKVVIKDIIM